MAEKSFEYEGRMQAEYGVFLLSGSDAPNPDDGLVATGDEILHLLGDGQTVIFFCQGAVPAPQVRLEVWDGAPDDELVGAQEVVVELGSGRRGLRSLLGGGLPFQFDVARAGSYRLRAHRSEARSQLDEYGTLLDVEDWLIQIWPVNA